jgi:hypothetical protein
MYLHISNRVIAMEGDGIGLCTRVHAIGCAPASACLYRHRAMNARP